MKGKVLIIDDEQSFRETMARLLRKRGLSCLTAGEGREGINLALKEHPDIIFCDIVMPGTDGISVLDELSRRYPQGAVVMITAHGTMETAIEALRKGAHDYLLKPIHLENLLKKIQTVLERKALMQEVGALRRELSRGVGIFEIVGESPRIREVVELTKKVSATRTPVLIRGETGTGKELVARAIHLQGDPPGKRFVAINCAAIPEQLLESELFGHMKGAFTGAVEAREGYFELADGGTLFLDEISEMPPGLQAKLLRATERKEILRIGGKNPLLVDVRIVSSTNRDLKQLAEEGRFRRDLLYRIQVMEIYLPPLRERREDIPLLLEYFVRRLSAELKRRCDGIESQAIRKLMAYSWPGNIRELRNVVERALIVGKDSLIRSEDLPAELGGSEHNAPHGDELKAALRSYEREHIRQVLRESRGHREQAAARLGIDRKTLYRKIADYGIDTVDTSVS